MPMPVYSPWTLFVALRTLSFWSLMNINLVWTGIFHPLQVFYPWQCFLYAHKAMWWALWVPFHVFPIYYPSRENWFHFTVLLLVDVIIYRNLLFAEGKNVNHSVNNWEPISFVFFLDIAFNVICLKFLLNGFPFCNCWIDHSIFL